MASSTRTSPPPAKPALVVLALLVYSAVMVSLTMLKAFFVIGLLWRPEAHRNRSLSLVPLNDFFEGNGWFSPLFGYGGNFAFFVPFGVLLYVLWRHHQKAWLKVMLAGMTFSLCIEAAQYAFSLGYSDIDDVIFNTLGALAGAGIAALAGPRFDALWIGASLLLGVVFVVLVILGPRLGDPDKVVELGAPEVSSAVAVSAYPR